MLIDSHVHLNLREFRADLDAVVRNARSAGVAEMLQIGYDERSLDETLSLADRYEDVYAAVGIHPHDAKSFGPDLERRLREALRREKVLAVGEIGLDFYRDLSPRDVQREVFRRQLRIAIETGSPVVIHSREAFAESIAILREEGAERVGGIFHAFPGTPAEAEQALELGFVVGIGGPLTYKNSRLRETAARLPSWGFVLETDCPYLPPEPYRGRRNEPANVAIVRDALAAIRGVSPADIERASALSYRRLLHGDRLPVPAVAYTIKNNVYVNVTSSCANACVFCARLSREAVLYGHNLRLPADPAVAEMVRAAAALARAGTFQEIVFCGYGEPTSRLADLLAAARELKTLGLPMRLDTNGQGSLVNGRDVVPELAAVFDAVSVSLGAHDAASYARLCRPDAGERAFPAVVDFVRRAAASTMRCEVTALDRPDVDVEACRALVAGIAGARFRVRRYQMEPRRPRRAEGRGGEGRRGAGG